LKKIKAPPLANSEYWLFMAGFGCYWAWIDSSYITSIMYHPESGEYALPLVHLGIIAAAILILAILIPFHKTLFRQNLRFLIISAALASLAGICLGAVGITGINAFFAGAIAFGGCAMALLGVSWSVSASTLGLKSAHICIPGVIVFAAIFNMFIDQAKPAFAMALTLVLPILSAVLLSLFWRKSPKGNHHDEAALDNNAGPSTWAFPQDMRLLEEIPWRFLLILALFCAAFGTMHYLIVIPESNADLISRVNILLRGLVAMVFFVGIGILSWKPTTVFKAGFLLMIAGFMAVPFVGNPSISSAIITAGYTCFDMLAWVVLCSLGFQFRFDVVRIVAVIRLTSLSGVLIGAVFGIVIEFWAPLGQANIAVAATAIAYLLVLGTILSLNQGPSGFWPLINEATPSAVTSVQEGMTEVIEIMAQQYNLTPREREFFGYLANGRSIPWISSHLTISDGTSRSHARHIYAKLQVHSRQELLDAVDQEVQNRACLRADSNV
jgi:DNA-binding CsgD family transcriptional regulator